MANILNELNRRVENDLGSDYVSVSGRKSDVTVTLDKYMQLMKKRSVFKIAFLSADLEGTFSAMDGDVIIVMPKEKFEEYATSTSTFATSRLLGVELDVVVYRVDEQSRKVYVELAGWTKARYSINIRSEINEEFARCIGKGEHPIVWGRVKRIAQGQITVDIFGKGVIGFIHKKHWSKEFIRNFESVCKEGEYYQFEVVGRAMKVEGKEPAWLLSRRNIVKSAWDEVDVEGLQEGGALLVTCVDKPIGKPYWWGRADRLPGIEIMGDYTGKFTNEGLYVSITYNCKIKYIDKDNRKISVAPFKVASSDVAKLSGLKELGGNVQGE